MIKPATQDILLAVAHCVVAQQNPGITAIELVSQPELLYKTSLTTDINWKAIAAQLNAPRDYVYHWYKETFSRQMSGDVITQQDKMVMQRLLIDAIQQGKYDDPQFADNLKAEVFGTKDIHRSAFSIVYNNVRRSKKVQAELEKAQKAETMARNAFGFLRVADGIKEADQQKPNLMGLLEKLGEFIGKDQ